VAHIQLGFVRTWIISIQIMHWGVICQYILFFNMKNCRNATWDEGGRCDVDIQPEANYIMLEPEPVYNQIISTVIKEMDYGDRKVRFLNITHLSQFRYDGHPSRHREPGTPVDAPQDCSHWCLPGIPDTWNEILYANLLSMGFRNR